MVVLTSDGLADGFRLAGCGVVVARAGDGADAALRELISGDASLVLVTADLWTRLDARLRGEVERRAVPVVMPVPVGGVGDGGTRAQLIGEMLQRAVGFRIELSPGGDR
jgi:vacuolar-type H+-ATPase subunit F/Vma7